jgi:hypothetical protein
MQVAPNVIYLEINKQISNTAITMVTASSPKVFPALHVVNLDNANFIVVVGLQILLVIFEGNGGPILTKFFSCLMVQFQNFLRYQSGLQGNFGLISTRVTDRRSLCGIGRQIGNFFLGKRRIHLISVR